MTRTEVIAYALCAAAWMAVACVQLAFPSPAIIEQIRHEMTLR